MRNKYPVTLKYLTSPADIEGKTFYQGNYYVKITSKIIAKVPSVQPGGLRYI